MMPTTMYGLIDGMSPEATFTFTFLGQNTYELKSKEMHGGVLAARTAMYGDLVSYWISNLAHETKRTYAIATLLHRCFKNYYFVDGLQCIIYPG